MLWTETGVSGDLVKRTDWKFELNTRFDNRGIATFFPQVGIEYKLTKWLKPSLEYRFIIDRNKYGNYKSSNRINLNLGFDKSVDRFAFDFRCRYQFGFGNSGGSSYDSDFDQSFRFKPGIEYDINNCIFSPTMSCEFFYNPLLGVDGRQFDKLRFAVGSKLELKGNHKVSFKYQFDKKLTDASSGLRHVLCLSYEYKL